MIYRFSLRLSNEQYLKFYRSQARYVHVTTHEGLSIKFPAEHLRAYVTHDGISGEFELESTEEGKFVALRRIN